MDVVGTMRTKKHMICYCSLPLHKICVLIAAGTKDPKKLISPPKKLESGIPWSVKQELSIQYMLTGKWLNWWL